MKLILNRIQNLFPPPLQILLPVRVCGIYLGGGGKLGCGGMLSEWAGLMNNTIIQL